MAKEFDYFKDFFTSFRDLFRNISLIIPFALILLLTVMFTIVMEFFPAALISVSTGIIVAVAAIITIGVLANWYFYVSGIYGAKLLVTGRKVSAKNIFGGGSRIYFRYLGMLVLQALIFLAPLIPVVLVLLAAIRPLLAGLGEPPSTALIILGLLLLLIYMLYAIFIYISFFFKEVFVSLKGSGPWRALRNSFRFLKKHPGHVLLCFLVVILAGMTLGAVSVIINLAFLPFTLLNTSIKSFVNILSTFLVGLLGMVLQPVVLIYLFKAFRAKEPRMLD